MNEKGQVINILPLIEPTKKTWICSVSCKIDPFIIDRYQKFLKAISTCTLKKIPQLLPKIYKCTVKNTNYKLDHTHACYVDTNICKVMSFSIQLLSPHFPRVRNIKRLIYRLTSFYHKKINLEKALIKAEI